MKKKVISILLIGILVFLIGCSDNTTTTDGDEETFTLEELSEFNGKDGKPAYIAVDGVVYDVTDAGPWENGDHNGFEAGKDLTEEIKNISPHGVSKLKGLPVVGKLEE